jgi:NAD(P)-dependent dehydrogenase (short-subunit alcohol dehydrogenase family)
MSFQNKTVLITGGTSGIGQATALAFLRRGANVVVAARNAERGQAAVAELKAQADDSTRLHFVPCDVTIPGDCQLSVDRAVEVFGGLDVLVNNAGVIVREKTVVQTSTEEWDLTFDVNVKGTFLMSRSAIPALTTTVDEARAVRPRGTFPTAAIVNNASYLGLVGGRGVAAYAASKGAIVNLTRAMALDHAPDGIRVNCIAPGSVETPMLHKEWEEMGGEGSVRHLFEEKHPLGRISQVEEIARTILFLAGPEASFITGACLAVDGGITAG